MLHYIVSVYTGMRANNHVNDLLRNNPSHYVDTHVQRLKNYGSADIKRVTFVISPCGDEERDNKVAELANGVDLGFAKTEAYVRDNNRYYSYGAWDDCITKNTGDLDFFLIEDDYFPSTENFYEPFVKSLRDNNRVAYCSQWYKDEHAAISNGCLSVKAVVEHQKKYDESLTLKRYDGIVYPQTQPPTPPPRQPMTQMERRRLNERQRRGEVIARGTHILHPGVYAQERFLRGYKELGYKFTDMMKDYCNPFLAANKQVIKYGNLNGKVLLECDFYRP